MNYIKQIWFELRERPLVTWVTISGTALSLFLLMAVYMADSINTVECAPETHRSRILYAPFIHAKSDRGDYSGSMSPEMAHKLYDNLPGISAISVVKSWNESVRASIGGNSGESVMSKGVDDKFWKIFDFDFVSGSPFTPAEISAGKKEVILTESTARVLGNGKDLTGRDVMINYIPYMVKGVVRDPNPLLKNSWSQVYFAWKEDDNPYRFSPETGETALFLLMEEGTDVEDVKKEVERRYNVYNAQVKPEGREIFYHGSPFTPEETSEQLYSNTTPDTKTTRWKRILLYAVLLLLPAINLSGMTRSRLRRRISEIGVRRAFGATRAKIISQLLTENFFLTLIGGLIGLALCFIFVVCLSHLFVNYVGQWNVIEVQTQATPAFTMLFTWKVFGIAMLLCFILNILSTGIPSWKATSENPAEAISGKHN